MSAWLPKPFSEPKLHAQWQNHNVNRRILILGGNLVFASLALLTFVMAELGCHSALSSSPPRLHHPPVSAREVALDLLGLMWFASAVGLFSRKRLAWIGSLLGVGATVCFCVSFLVTIVSLNVYPRNGEGLPTDISTVGFVVFALGMWTIPFALSLGLFLGLLKMRKELR